MVTRPIHRWLRFSLRTMLILLMILCLRLGWQTKTVRERKAALAKIVAEGGSSLPFPDHLPVLTYWRRWVGDEEIFFLVLPERYALKIGLTETDKICGLFPEAVLIVETTWNGEGVRYQYAEWRFKHYGHEPLR
jgi:hypothetical protein